MSAILPRFPSLDDSKWLRLICLAFLYAGQGLPIGIYQVALPAYMASLGMSAAEIGGFIAFVFIPWSFKLFAGPVMDKFSFLPMGRRRPWILLAQTGLLLSFLVLCFLNPEPASEYWLLAALGFLSNIFGALQDVAVDGMAIDLLREDERAQGNAFMYGGQMTGISLAGAVSSWALMNSGLILAASLMGLCVFLILLIPLCLRERPGERILPWTQGIATSGSLSLAAASWKSILTRMFQALLLPMSILLVLIEALNRMTSGLLVAASPVLTVQELGWPPLDYSNWIAVTGVIAAITGVILGPFIDRIGSLRILKWIVLFRLFTFLAMSYFDNMWGTFSLFESFILVNAIATQIVTVALIALFMRLCLQRVAASQFAVYMALANLTYSMGSGLLVPLSKLTDYSGMMLFSGLMLGLMLLLLRFVNFDRHDRDLLKLA
ncbi:MAG: MFS transporter [Gammaproteobacteria bacterium]|jgi:MFS transporter, PAT family, beta-lactamase induction signal transducer AmpG|nr:MFS transporter [Gammaproteobacteria bacterium]MBT5603554.1 MFS transporter [Gammaproteobacteria bacterium]